MNIKDMVLEKYPLLPRMHCGLDCFRLDKRRYLVFWHELINEDSIADLLEKLLEKASASNFSIWKTLIVIGKTTDEFKKQDLLFFDGVSTFAVFYLVNEQTGKVFMNDSWIFPLGCNFKRHIRKINRIITGK